MVATIPSTLFQRWLARLTAPQPDHARFVGEPLSIEGLGPLEIGRLWPAVRRADGNREASAPAREAAAALRRACEAAGIEPAFDAASGLAMLQTLAVGRWADALADCRRLAVPLTPPLQREIDRILGPTDHWPEGRRLDAVQALALARLAGTDRRADVRARLGGVYDSAPFKSAELEVMAQLSTPGLLALAATPHWNYWLPGMGSDQAATALSAEPAYVAFARESLQAALQRLEDLHAGRLPYVADGAFGSDDGAVLGRCARLAAWRDDAWFGPLVLRLFPLVCVAPTSAKTAPSQSLAIALGHAVEGMPTPEGVQALREALAVVRHAGVKKKIARNLKPAERALAARPELALRLAANAAKADRRQLAMIANCLEAGWWQGLRWTPTQWQAQIATPVNARPFALGLIWRAEAPDNTAHDVMMAGDVSPPCFVDLHDEPVQPQASWTLRLWHPVQATAAQREAWRAKLAARRLKQPLRQAFREIYLVSDAEAAAPASVAFAGHELSIRPLIGLARKEGWRIGGGLVRSFGATRVTFLVSSNLYPGLEGACESMSLRFEQVQGRQWAPLAIGEVDPILYSEVCRAVDLLVSVSAFAVEDGGSPNRPTASDLGPHPAGEAPPKHQLIARARRIGHLAMLPLPAMARLRREVLAKAFAAAFADGRAVLEERHLMIGRHAVHLSTGRVTRDGEPVELPPRAAGRRLSAVPWLPYDEVLLQRIADAVSRLLEGA